MIELIKVMMITALVPASVLMTVLWVYQIFRKNAGVVDIGWALGLAVMVWVYAVLGTGYYWRKVFVAAMVTLWAFRLSWLLVRRMLREKKEDSRYQLLRKDWGKFIDLKFFLLFQFEVLLDLALSIPFLIICLNPAPQLHVLEVAAVILWVIGLSGETLADEQLKRFKSNPANKGGVCQVGLWNYSRHPNYFFEWTMWVAYFVFALASPWGWIAVTGPLIMLHFLINVTGIPFAEQQALKTKGEAYAQYQRTTSFFVPWLKKNIQ